MSSLEKSILHVNQLVFAAEYILWLDQTFLNGVLSWGQLNGCTGRLISVFEFSWKTI